MSEHPLDGISMRVRNFKCFGEEGGGFEPFAPINIVIGRNNSGKSALIDAIAVFVSGGKMIDANKHFRISGEFAVRISHRLDESLLKNYFPEGRSSSEFSGDHWLNAGQRLVNSVLCRDFNATWRPTFVSVSDIEQIVRAAQEPTQRRLEGIDYQPLNGLKLIRIDAERNVLPEGSSNDRKVAPNGQGLTNLVRAFINNENLPRSDVEVDLLSDLNQIYLGDCVFSRIICQENDGGFWEIFLTDNVKGDIRLSQSGSSLRSIFIILAMLRLAPKIDKTNWNRAVLAIEEPENNLHPALLRRLLEYLAEQRSKLHFTLIVATHSPICIDWSTGREDTQIVHVRHKDGVSISRRTLNYSERRDILDDLDIRASDILQSNCIIWVEGPTDRLYLRKWIELVSGGVLKERVHYTTMFYGGKLRSHLDALPPDEGNELISLLSINRNAALLMDSDRKPAAGSTRRPHSRLDRTKHRLKAEIERVDGFCWITLGREVENYVPGSVLERIAGEPIGSFTEYDQVWKREFLPSFKEDKIAIALAAVNEFTLADMEGHLDLQQQVEQLCARIRDWNGLT